MEVVAWLRAAAALQADLAQRSGLAPADRSALQALDGIGGGRVRVGDLASALGLSSAATTGVIDRLVSAGLAAREADEHDRRVVRVRLTPLAREFAASHLAPVLQQARLAAAALDDDELQVVLDFLRNVRPTPQQPR